MRFRDRSEAGSQLAGRLVSSIGQPDCVVVALPRGGVPVAFEIARRLGAPMDVCLVRKLGAPDQPEFAIGALAAGGIELLNQSAIRGLRLSPEQISRIVEKERRELVRREAELRGVHPRIPIAGMHAIVVDDGLATGSTMRAAIAALRQGQASRITVAVPVAAASVLRMIARCADTVVCLYAPERFEAVSRWYVGFDQVDDATVRDLLARSRPCSSAG